MSSFRLLAVVLAGLAFVAACNRDPGGPAGAQPAAGTTTPPPASPVTAAAPAVLSVTTAAPSVTVTSRPSVTVVDIPCKLERRTTDAATAGFSAVVDATLADGRGWKRAGFALRPAPDAPYTIVLAEPDDAESLCRPYDVFRQYSCQNGPVVVLNAERWRAATPQWTGDLATYRVMLVNHEVGHLLGLHHPDVQCPAPGAPAPVMAQQSTELGGCRPNPWPLDAEIAIAARHDLPLAPPFSR